MPVYDNKHANAFINTQLRLVGTITIWIYFIQYIRLTRILFKITIESQQHSQGELKLEECEDYKHLHAVATSLSKNNQLTKNL